MRRLRRTWSYVQQATLQCTACTGVGLGVRHCCDPWLPLAGGQQGRHRLASCRTLGHTQPNAGVEGPQGHKQVSYMELG